MLEYRAQPWKSIYLISQSCLLFVKVPWWIITHLLPSSKTKPSWPLLRLLRIRATQTDCEWRLAVGRLQKFPSHETLLTRKGITGIWIKPVPNLIFGEIKAIAQKNDVSSISIPGYWLHHNKMPTMEPGASPVAGEKVSYHLHGGTFMHYSANSHDYTAMVPKSMLKHCPQVTRTFSVEYRLSVTSPYKPSGAFPSALLDALAGYNYLVNEVGFAPEDIIIVGDSAGGNLALALVRYLIEYAEIDPANPLPRNPGGIILLSPVTDFGSSHFGSPMWVKNDAVDWYKTLRPDGAAYIARALSGSLNTDLVESSQYLSPGSKNPLIQSHISFHGFPKTFIAIGGHEVLLEQTITLKDRMVRDLGNEHVTFFLAPGGCHDYVSLPFYVPERAETLNAISTWMSTL